MQIQQAWAYSNNVNLLAANANWPSLSGSGSGIYAGKNGIMNVIVSDTPITKVLKAKIPVDSQPPKNLLISAKNMQSFTNSFKPKSMKRTVELKQQLNLRKENLSKYNIQFLDFSKNTSQIGRLCHNGICCKYAIQVADTGKRAKIVSALVKSIHSFPLLFLIKSHCFCVIKSRIRISMR